MKLIILYRLYKAFIKILNITDNTLEYYELSSRGNIYRIRLYGKL